MMGIRLVAFSIAALTAASCTDAPETKSPPVSSLPISQAATDAAMAKWSRSCVLCHVAGEGSAPRVGHPDEWAERLEQGEDVLLAHTVEGYNNMPPLGYCMACEEDDFRAMIRFMAGGS